MICSLGGPWLAECLSALRRQATPHEPWVLLDGASEGDADAWRARFPEAQVVACAERRGFAPCAQVGLERARALGAEWALLLNDDVSLDPGALDLLLAAAQADPRAGALAPLLLDPLGRVNSYGLEVNLLGCARDRARGRPAEEALRLAPAAIAASAAALLVRIAALPEGEPLDPGYRYYYEDVDLGLALRDGGWTVRLVPDARGVHLESQSIGRGSPRKAHYLARNQVRFVLRTFPRRHLTWILPLALGRLALRPAVHAAHGEWRHAWATFTAGASLLRALPQRRPMGTRTFRQVAPRLRWRATPQG
ncbi:MAG: glycosyltransferase [Planctomycetota bacterium]